AVAQPHEREQHQQLELADDRPAVAEELHIPNIVFYIEPLSSGPCFRAELPAATARPEPRCCPGRRRLRIVGGSGRRGRGRLVNPHPSGIQDVTPPFRAKGRERLWSRQRQKPFGASITGAGLRSATGG